jgi:hypothetical protein
MDIFMAWPELTSKLNTLNQRDTQLLMLIVGYGANGRR